MTIPPDRWLADLASGEHVVEVDRGGWRNRYTWYVDGDLIAEKTTNDDHVVLTDETHGSIAVKAAKLVGPSRRVTWYEPGDTEELLAHTGVGGIDLDPEPGSKAAQREAWIRAHPRLHTARRTLTAAAAVLIPLLLIGLLPRLNIPWPSIPWPGLPSIPWPDLGWPWFELPRIPWPDLGWPWFQLPDLPSLPQWVWDVIDKAKYVVPVLIAFAVARGEIRRRRNQDAAKAGRVPADKGRQDEANTSATARIPASTSANDVDSGDSPTRSPDGSR